MTEAAGKASLAARITGNPWLLLTFSTPFARPGPAVGAASSTMLFHALQVSHFPAHFGVPHTGFVRAHGDGFRFEFLEAAQ